MELRVVEAVDALVDLLPDVLDVDALVVDVPLIDIEIRRTLIVE